MATAITAASKRTLDRGAIKRYSASIVSQGVLSAFNFALGIFTLRVLSLHDFGLFAFVLVLANAFAGVGNALASTPLLVMTPALARRGERIRLEATLSAANGLMTLTLAGAATAGFLTFGSSAEFSLAGAAFIAASCLRNHWRVFAFARRVAGASVVSDLVYVGVATVGLGTIAAATGGTVEVEAALAVLGGASLCSMIAIRRRLGIALRFRLRRFMPAVYRRVWDESRWSLLGVITTSLQTQAHSFVVTAFAGPAAFAPLAAGNALFGPMRMTVVAWQMVARPDFAAAIGRNDQARLWRTVKASAAVFLAGNLIFILSLYGVWDFVDAHLFRQKYADQPMLLIVALWTAVSAVSSMRGVLSGAIQAYRDFRRLALSTVQGGLISMAVATALFLAFDPAASLLGILAGEIFALAYLVRLCAKKQTVPCPA
jgi:O-antigen/teichoic acid export membrane protein